MSEMVQRKRVEGEAFWRAHAEAWQQSGQTLTAYLAEHGLCRSTFRRWRGQLGFPAAARSAGSSHPPRLVRVQVGPSRPVSGEGHCRVQLPNGIALDWPVSVPAERLGLLIAVLRQWT